MSKKISRRDAIKRIGATMLSSAIASSGLFSLVTCKNDTKRRIILYFTGTGNCLYLARQIANDGDEILSIPQLVKNKQYDLEADEIGIGYPIYGHMPPYMVRDYINKAHFKAKYKFAVLTYGKRKCSAVEIWDKVSHKAGNPFDYISTIVMVDNWLPNIDMNEQIKINKHIPENLAKINNDISHNRVWHEPVSAEERLQHQEFMERSGLDTDKGFLKKSEQSFTISESCIECGVCVSVCPRGNYELTSEGAKTVGDCEYRFAYIQNCPQKAILFAEGSFPNGTEKNPNARYRNEHVSLMDIKLANNQKL